MRVRTAEVRDIPAILAIWNPAIRDSLATFNHVEKSNSDIATMLAEKETSGHAFLVAEAEGILGFAYYGQFRGGAGYAHTMEHTIYVVPEAMGWGVGKALMAAVEDHARSGGAHLIFAGVSADNPDGIAFHKRLGYVKAAHLPEVGRKFGQWRDLVLLQKHL